MDDDHLASTRDENATKRIGDIDVPCTRRTASFGHSSGLKRLPRRNENGKKG